MNFFQQILKVLFYTSNELVLFFFVLTRTRRCAVYSFFVSPLTLILGTLSNDDGDADFPFVNGLCHF